MNPSRAPHEASPMRLRYSILRISPPRGTLRHPGLAMQIGYALSRPVRGSYYAGTGGVAAMRASLYRGEGQATIEDHNGERPHCYSAIAPRHVSTEGGALLLTIAFGVPAITNRERFDLKHA